MKNKFNRPNASFSLKLGITLGLCLSGLAHAQDVPAPTEPDAPHGLPLKWNDTFVGFRYGNDFHFPGNAADVKQKIGFATTTGGFKYGNYTLNVDYLVSDKNNPEANSMDGSQEVYSVGRVEWSASKIMAHPFINGIIRDYGLTTGFEFSSKNDIYGSRAQMLIAGPTVDFSIDRGFLNLTAGVRTETNHNGIVHADVDYSTAWHLESAWLVPFNVASVPVVFKGFAAVTGPKGKDGFHIETKTETLTRMSVLFDVGAPFGTPRTFYFGPGYEYWKNMFGTPASEAAGTKRSTFMLVGEAHF